MATNNTGTYTLRQLLSGETVITIPDMQRDYCWGLDNVSPDQPREKVSTFISALVDLYNISIATDRHDATPSLGLVYGYSLPPKSRNFMIIDGQQRLTTLYLLLGMLYRRVPEPWLENMLVSITAMADGRSPRLVYQMRNEALFFMQDLVANFFLDRSGRLSQIKSSPWYFRSYDTDNTVSAFISAIRHIDEVLERKAPADWADFARFIVDDLTLMYYDIGLRSRAEKMFITINTTGQPLTRAESLKTLMYAASPDQPVFARRWEEMERWFWQHRGDNPGPTTASPAISRFLDLYDRYMELTASKSTVAPYSEEQLFAFFDTYAMLCSEIPEAAYCESTSTNAVMVILGSMAYTMRFGRGARAYWEMLTNISRYQRAPVNGTDAQAAIAIVGKMPTSDIISLLKLKGKYPRLINDEERCKLQALSRAGRQRRSLQRIIRRGERHPLLCGRMSRLIEWCTSAPGAPVNAPLLKRYVNALYDLWGSDLNDNEALEPLRRLLLGFNHPGYPMRRRAGLSTTLCIRDYEWQRLMLEHPDLIRRACDSIITAR